MKTVRSKWPEVSLGDICELKYGKSLPEANRMGGAIPVYGSNGIVGYHNEAMTQGGTIVVGRKGSYGEVNYSPVPCWPIDTTYYIDSTSTEADIKWLAHRLPGLGLTSLNRAAAVPGLNRDDAYRQRLLLPPLAEQQRIAAILDRADDLRAKRRAALAHLDTLAQSIFLDMFGDPATNPRGWPLLSIDKIGDVVTGNTPSRANPEYYGAAIEWIKSDNLNTPYYYITKAEEGLSESGKAVSRIVPSGSILVTCIAGSPESIGNAAIADREVAFNQQINAIVPSQGEVYFLYVQILVGKGLIQQASTASMKGMVSKSRFKQVLLMFPPINLQREFACRTAVIEKLKATHRASLAELDALFASLQFRAFRGEL